MRTVRLLTMYISLVVSCELGRRLGDKQKSLRHSRGGSKSGNPGGDEGMWRSVLDRITGKGFSARHARGPAALVRLYGE